jgi:hypothetical protein
MPEMRADTFHLFAFLPKELRLQIWNYALKARVIALHRTNDRLKGRGIYYPMRVATVGFIALSTNHPSYDILRLVCPEAQLVCQRRFIDFEIWDVRKSCLGTPYDPVRDVVYFSHSIDWSILLDFTTQHPAEANSLLTIALPSIISSAMISRKDILAGLHAFENLMEVIIVVGNAGIHRESVSWLGGTQTKDSWLLPRSAEEALEQLRDEKWPDWKIPIVTVVRSPEDILTKDRTPMWTS